MTPDAGTARQAAHKSNIDRYRKILQTPLTDHERQFVMRRLAEEEQALRDGAAAHQPVDFVR